jgi:hypothetical protein
MCIHLHRRVGPLTAYQVIGPVYSELNVSGTCQWHQRGFPGLQGHSGSIQINNLLIPQPATAHSSPVRSASLYQFLQEVSE